MLVPTNKEVIDYLYTNVLLFDDDDITSCRSAGLNYYHNLPSQTYEDLETLRKKNKISMPIWHSLTDFKIYAESTKPSFAATMLMIKVSWEAVNLLLLHIHHELSQMSIASMKPEITADTVTSTQIDTILFLKYCNITLLDKANMIHFYDPRPSKGLKNLPPPF